MRDLQPILDRAMQVLHTHELDHPGAYARWIWQNSAGDRALGLNEYGCGRCRKHPIHGRRFSC